MSNYIYLFNPADIYVDQLNALKESTIKVSIEHWDEHGLTCVYFKQTTQETIEQLLSDLDLTLACIDCWLEE